MAILVGVQKITRRLVFATLHIGEPSLSWKATLVGPLQRSTKLWRHFQIHPFWPPGLHFSDMASSELAFNMVENRGMGPIPATCTNV